MTPPDGWADAAVAFLLAHLPRRGAQAGWDHMFSSAYQMGTEALAALGHAEEVVGGAIPVADPRLPDVFPRWDDVCVVLLALAEQQGLLLYRRADGTPMPPRGRAGDVVVVDRAAPPPAPPNVAAAHGLGPALADPPFDDRLCSIGLEPPSPPGALATFTALGLVTDGAWTAAAETILWRTHVPEWSVGPTADPRFAAALDHALATLPGAIRAEIERLVTVTEADLVALHRRQAEAAEELRRRFAGELRSGPDMTGDQLRAAIPSLRRNDLDWLLYRGWRLPDGWLAEGERARALSIFHDPLAIAMRRALVARLHPDRPAFAE